MRKMKLFFTALAVMMTSVAFAQNIKVTGNVTDSSTDEAVPFAAVHFSGTMQGVSTDAEGNYSIEVPADGVLVFSSIGYKNTQVAVDGRSVIDVKLDPDAEALDETIVVAYGVQKKSSFVGSATQLSGQKLESMQTSNVAKSLEGAVAGLQTSSSTGTPGSGSTIIIRGFGSVSASQSPLIVLDGVPYEGSLNSIPAQDIESLTVLKDAAANSMYGARGSNGVIMVTTKSGSSGKVQITFEGKVGVNSRGVSAYDVIDNPADYYEMTWESIRNSMYYGGSMGLAQAGIYASSSLVNDYGLYNIYKGIDNNAIVDPSTGKVNANAKDLKWTDNWNKDIFQPGVRQEYNVTASGGSDKTRAYMSLSYLDDAGYVANSGFKRLSARGKIDQNIGKHIHAGLSFAYSNTDQQMYNDSEGSNYSNLFFISQYMPAIYPIYLYDRETGERQYGPNGEVLYDWGEDGRPVAASTNAYGQLMTSKKRYVSDNITTRGYLNIDILKDLKFSANVAYDVFNGKYDYFTTPAGGDALAVNGRGQQETTRYTALNANQLLTYAPTFGDHSLNILIGHETKSDDNYTLYGHMTNFVLQDVTDFSNAVVYQELDSSTSSYFLQGYFGRAEYSYGNKYYASASYRRDGSSRFAPENRWGSFWSVGASWNLKNESFLINVPQIDLLKIKASYGTQGNDNLGYTKVYEDLYSITRVDGQASLNKVFRAAPEVTWEKSNNFNVGIEAKVFDRFNLNFEYFIKETKDMIYSKPLAPSQGLPGSQLVNDMDMKNTGVEFEISADIIKTRDILWNVSLNGTHYKNVITKLPSDYPEEGKQVGSYWREVGGSLYDYYLYEWAGVDPENGLPLYNSYYKVETEVNPETGESTEIKVIDPEGDQVQTVNSTSSGEATRRKIGKTPIPDLYGGFSTYLSLYGFDLSASFAYQLGGWTLDSNYQTLMSAGDIGSNWHKDIYNRWTPENTQTDVPRVQNGSQTANETSTRFLIKSSYISLRNATIGYTIPQTVTKKIGVEKLRVFVTGDNLWYLSKRKGLEVRNSLTGSTGFVYSALRTVSAGVTVTF